MVEPIRVKFRWTVDEALKAQRWHFRQRSSLVRLLIWLCVGLSFSGGFYEWWQSGTIEYPAFLIPLIFLVSFYFLRPFVIRREFAKRPDRDSEVSWTITGEQLDSRYAHGSSDLKWSALYKVYQTPDGFLFYPNAQIFYWLPRHGFASGSDFTLLSELARSKVPSFEETK